jgi:hypothetical protein
VRGKLIHGTNVRVDEIHGYLLGQPQISANHKDGNDDSTEVVGESLSMIVAAPCAKMDHLAEGIRVSILQAVSPELYQVLFPS